MPPSPWPPVPPGQPPTSTIGAVAGPKTPPLMLLWPLPPLPPVVPKLPPAPAPPPFPPLPAVPLIVAAPQAVWAPAPAVVTPWLPTSSVPSIVIVVFAMSTSGLDPIAVTTRAASRLIVPAAITHSDGPPLCGSMLEQFGLPMVWVLIAIDSDSVPVGGPIRHTLWTRPLPKQLGPFGVSGPRPSGEWLN